MIQIVTIRFHHVSIHKLRMLCLELILPDGHFWFYESD